MLARNFLFALFISVYSGIDAGCGLEVVAPQLSDLGLLFTSMGAGSVIGAVFIIPWLRARLSPMPMVTLSANLLLALAYVLMALVRQSEVFFVVAALAVVGWTMSASELWVAAQRGMAGWARGRMNAAVIMISQGAMAMGGVIWGSAAAIAGASYTLLGAAALFVTSLLLGPSAFDQLCRKPRREGFRPFVSPCRTNRDDTNRRTTRELLAMDNAYPRHVVSWDLRQKYFVGKVGQCLAQSRDVSRSFEDRRESALASEALNSGAYR